MRPYAMALICFATLLLHVQAGRNHGGYEGGYGRRHNDGRKGGEGCGGYGAPPPPTHECKPPCHRNYGVPGQEECVCPEFTTPVPSTCPACECSTPTTIECTTSTVESTTTTAESTTSTVESTTSTVESTTLKSECDVRCRNGFVEFQQRCWRLTHLSNLNASTHLADCTKDNSSMASILNQAQNDFVQVLASTGLDMTYDATNKVWFPPIGWNHVRIGAIETLDGWKWFDRKPFDNALWVSEMVVQPESGPEKSTSAILPDLRTARGKWRAIPHKLLARKGVCVYDLQT